MFAAPAQTDALLESIADWVDRDRYHPFVTSQTQTAENNVLKSISDLQLGVKCVSKQLLELGADVQQVNLRATHRDTGQSGLSGPRTLQTKQTRVRHERRAAE